MRRRVRRRGYMSIGDDQMGKKRKERDGICFAVDELSFTPRHRKHVIIDQT
jgi:hypothetical protein